MCTHILNNKGQTPEAKQDTPDSTGYDNPIPRDTFPPNGLYVAMVHMTVL